MKIFLKKSMAALLSLAMIFSLMVAPVGALEVDSREEADVVVTVGDATISEMGVTVEVPVTVEFVSEDAIFDAFGLEFVFNENNFVMSPSTGRKDPVIGTGDDTLCESVTGNDKLKTAAFADSSGYGISQELVDELETNILFYLKLDAVEDYIDGEYTLDVNIIDNLAANFAYHSQGLNVLFVPGTITMTGGISAATLTPSVTVAPAEQSKTYGDGTNYTALTASYEVEKEGEISYQWYKNDVAIEGATAATYTPADPVVGTTDTYYVVVSNTYLGSPYKGTSNSVTVTYNKATVDVSGCTWNYTDSLAYTGSEQTVELSSVPTGAIATYTGNAATAVGSYTAEVAFSAEDNYIVTGKVSKLSWKIVAADLVISGDKDVAVYNNQMPVSITDADVKAASVDGCAVNMTVAEKSDSKNLITVADNKITATGNGTGTATVTVTFTADNHNKATVEVTVTVSDKIDVTDKLVFTAKEGPASYDLLNNTTLADYVNALDYSGVASSGTPSVTYFLNDQAADLSTAITAAGTYVVKAVYEDDLYSGVKTIEFTVNKAQLNVNGATWDYTNAFTYDGTEQKVELTGLPEGVTATYTGNTGIDAGEYTASVTFALAEGYSAENYEIVGEVASCGWVINKAVIEKVPTVVEGLIYTGEEQTGVKFELGNGYMVAVSAQTFGTDAGTYTAIFAADSNHYWPADLEGVNGEVYTLEWSIAKAKVDASTVAWNYTGAFTYTGEPFTVEVTGLPVGVEAAYTGNTATNAGDYTATVVLTCTDSNNCEVEGTVAPLSWKIEKADGVELTKDINVRYDVTSDQTFTAAELTALLNDSNADTQAVIKSLDIYGGEVLKTADLKDGNVVFSLRELTKEAAGKSATICAYYETNNHKESTATITITVIDKNDVSDKLTFASGSGTYTGEAHTYEKAKVASGYTGTITYTYSGNMIDAGTYTVTATYEDDFNYGVITAEYVIKPASISISSVTVADKEYDATTAATIETVKFSGLKGEDTVDYTVVSAVYSDANAGTSKKVTYEIALAESVINYTLSKGTGSVSNAKITAKSLTVEIADIAEQTYTGSAIQPEVEINFVGLMGEDQLTAGTNYTVKYTDNVNAGEAKVTVAVKSSKNYTFEATEKTFVIAKATPVVIADNLEVGYTGAVVPAEKITGTATFNDKAIKGTWSWVEAFEGIELGEYADVKVLFTPENESLNAVECTIVVTIVKGIPEGEPSYTAIKTSGKTLVDAELGLGTLPEGGTIEWVAMDEETGEYVAVDPSTVEVKSNVAYAWRYTPAADMAENYDVKIGTIVVWYVAPYVAPSYSITVVATENGDVTVDARSAEKGEVITVTVAPADGYELDELTVVAADDSAIEVTEVSEGVYTFVMPAAKVTVTATFAKEVALELIFSDVAVDDWFYSYVEYAYENDLMNGVSETEFDPYGETTRAMIVTVLWRLEGEPVVNYLMQFEDVENDTWYTEAVRWAASEGIVNGYSDTAFGPTDAITREQMVTILYRYAQYKGYDVSVGEDTNILSYEDALTISEYAIPAMQWACGAGLVQGDGVNLTPKATANRAQVAAIFQRFDENVAI